MAFKSAENGTQKMLGGSVSEGVDAGWLKKLTRHWGNLTLVHVKCKASNNQRDSLGIGEVGIPRTDGDGKEIDPGTDARTVAAQCDLMAHEHCERNAGAGYYGIVLYGPDPKTDQMVVLDESWRRIVVGNGGGLSAAEEGMMSLVGQLRGSLNDARDYANKKDDAILKMADGTTNLVSANTDLVSRIPQTMGELFDKLDEANRKNADVITSFYEHQQNETTKKEGFKAATTFGLAILQYSLARETIKTGGEPPDFDPEEIMNRTEDITDVGGLSNLLLDDLTITDEQDPIFRDIMGDELVDDWQNVCAGQYDDPEELFEVAKTIIPRVEQYLPQLFAHFNEKQIRAMQMIQKMASASAPEDG